MSFPHFVQESCLSKFFILAGFRHVQMHMVNLGGNENVVDRDLRRDHMGNLRPLSEIINRTLLIYQRAKTKTSMLKPAEIAHATVCCTCEGEHTNLRVVMGKGGIPKEVVGRLWKRPKSPQNHHNNLLWMLLHIEHIQSLKIEESVVFKAPQSQGYATPDFYPQL